MKVKIFTAKIPLELEREINEWLEGRNIKIIEKIQTTYNKKSEDKYYGNYGYKTESFSINTYLLVYIWYEIVDKR